MTPSDRLTIERGRVEAVSPEGATASMPLAEFVDALRPPSLSTEELIVPDGIRATWSTRHITVVVWEIPPRVHLVRWISPDSPAPFRMPGRDVTYRERSLAMPYLLIFAVFARDRTGRLVLSGRNEAYFRTQPMRSPDDELCFTGLLNVSKFPRETADASPLAWICTQYAPLRKLAAVDDVNRRLRESLETLRRTILETGFNYSSEHHELTSYWSLSRKSIPEIADLDRWERLSRENPLFVLDLKWLPARWRRRRLTVRRLFERIVTLNGGPDDVADASTLARIVHHGAASRKDSA